MDFVNFVNSVKDIVSELSRRYDYAFDLAVKLRFKTPLASGILRRRALISILKNTFDPAEFSFFLLN